MAEAIGAYARPLWVGGPVALPVGVGTWQWGDSGYWGYGRAYSSDDVEAAYEESRAAGLTFFDSAEGYGNGTSEWLLGHLIRDRNDRGTAIVATKFGAMPWRVGRRGALLKALDASLARLMLPRVDLYQIHWSLPLLSDRAWLLDLAAAVRQGLVGAVGVSNYGAVALRGAYAVLCDAGVPLATNQVRYNLLSREPERSGLVRVCADLGVTLIAYSPLAQGLLTGKYSTTSPPPGIRRMQSRRHLARLAELLALLREVGTDNGGKSPAQVALNWLATKGAVPIPGAKNRYQAKHNAGAAGWRLSGDQVAALDAWSAR